MASNFNKETKIWVGLFLRDAENNALLQLQKTKFEKVTDIREILTLLSTICQSGAT